MRPPPGYLKDNELRQKVLRLKRSLPGLKQAGYEWVEELAGVFTDLGFSHSKVDQAVYYKHAPNKHIVITVSVDDMAVTTPTISPISSALRPTSGVSSKYQT